jgi:UDP-galactopyranose mutase
MECYDIIFVGAGLTNATIAYQIAKYHYTDRPLKMLMIDRRDHIAGNCFTRNMNGIDVHEYGAHIFHTSNKVVYDFITQFGSWHNFVNSPIALYRDKDGQHVYNLPFNMNTFAQVFPSCAKPEDARKMIEHEVAEAGITTPKNLAEQAISMVGTSIFEKLIKGYTEKQWGKPCEELPPHIIKRLPVRFSYDNNYFNDTYQIIPDNGYTAVIEQMLDEANHPGSFYMPVHNQDRILELRLGVDYQFYRKNMNSTIYAPLVFYSGCIDELFDYALGTLEYRSVEFETTVYDMDNFQGNAVFNHTSTDVPYTRSIEHKWFNPAKKSDTTVVSYEFSKLWKPGTEPYYPVGDLLNNSLYQHYLNFSKTCWTTSAMDIRFVGRLGTYRYMDMDDCIMEAFKVCNTLP